MTGGQDTRSGLDLVWVGAPDPRWDAFVASHPSGSQGQSYAWGAFQGTRSWEVGRLGAVDDGRVVGVAQVLTRPLPVGGSLAYVDRGPLVADDHAGVAGVIVDEVRRFFRAHHGLVLVIDPPDHRTGERLGRMGFSPASFKATLEATTAVKLSRPTDDILASMKPKTRYNVRKSLRSDLRIRHGDAGDAAVFHRILERTARHQGFTANSRSYIERFLTILGEAGNGALFLAEHDGAAVAGILVTAFGSRAVYKRGGWSGNAGSLRPNEGLHWAAMRWARDQGCRWYDFDGIDLDVAKLMSKGEALSEKAERSVTRFKLGFGGDVVHLPRTMVWIPNRLVRLGHDTILPRVAHRRIVKRALRRVQVAG